MTLSVYGRDAMESGAMLLLLRAVERGIARGSEIV